MALSQNMMKKEDVMSKIAEMKIVPVVKISHLSDALPLAEALINGGLPVAEITFRTEAAAESIRKIREEYPDMIVGAGTVVNMEQAKKAYEVGAMFIVTPGLNEEVIVFAKEHDLAVIPGVCTPTEIITAMNYDLDVVKFFPANIFGGLNAIKAFSGPFPTIRFMPTGGINEENINDYLSLKSIVACGGSWMVNPSWIESGDFQKIKEITTKAVETVMS